MLQLIQNFLTKRKKEALKKRKPKRATAKHVAVIPATPAPKEDETHLGIDVVTVDPVATAPFWYLENGSYENVSFEYPSEDLKVPVFNREARSVLTKYLWDVCPEPDGSMAIYQKLNDPDVSVKEIAALVSSDPLLAARILKQVNSAAFGVSQEVTSVGRAVTLLGFQNVKSLVLSHAVRSGLSPVKDERSLKVHEHSLMSSAVAFHIAERISGVDHFTVSTIALLHDMGKVLYPMLVEKGRKINLSIDVPPQVLESMVTSVFAEIWKLPPTIVKALEYMNHAYFYPIDSVPEDIRKIVAILSVSNLISKAMGFDDGDPLYMLREEYLKECRLSESPARWLDEGLASKIEMTRGVLK